MRSVTAVGFDLDDTLFDHTGATRAAVRAFVRELGRPWAPVLEQVWFAAERRHFELWRSGQVTFSEQRRGRLRDFLPALPGGGAVPTDDDEIDSVFATYLDCYRKAWRPAPDAVHTLQRLRHAGIVTGVLTNGQHEQQLAKLEVTGLRPLVEVVCSSEGLGVAKPDPAAFQLFCGQLGTPAGRVGFIGDNLAHDVQAGRRAGLQARLLATPDRPPPHRPPPAPPEIAYASLADAVSSLFP